MVKNAAPTYYCLLIKHCTCTRRNHVDPHTLAIQHPGFSDKIISDAHTLEKQHPGSRDTLEKQILAINEEYQQGIYIYIYKVPSCIMKHLSKFAKPHLQEALKKFKFSTCNAEAST